MTEKQVSVESLSDYLENYPLVELNVTGEWRAIDHFTHEGAYEGLIGTGKWVITCGDDDFTHPTDDMIIIRYGHFIDDDDDDEKPQYLPSDILF